jgi:hypothetical protein
MASKRKMGRPTKGDAARTIQVSFKVSQREHTAWSRAADAQRLADWIREQCNRAARG